MVAINDTTLMSIGGGDKFDYLSRTYFYDAVRDEWNTGPELNVPTASHSCAAVNWINPETGQVDRVVVVAGGEHEGILDKVELLFLNDVASGWKFGPKLPMNTYYSALVEYDDSVILVGGDGKDSSAPLNFYQLSSSVGPWVQMPHVLPNRITAHLAILIPDELTSCSENSAQAKVF